VDKREIDLIIRASNISEEDLKAIVESVVKKFGRTREADRFLRRERFPIVNTLLGMVELNLNDLARSLSSITMDPGLLPAIAKAMVEQARFLNATAIGGPATSAVPLVVASAFVATMISLDGPPKKPYWDTTPDPPPIKKAFYVNARSLEGATLGQKDRVVLMDDVLASGQSILGAAKIVRETGATLVGTVFLVDRQEGGAARLEEEKIKVFAFYKKNDLVHLRAIFDEIKAKIK
jgi:orotate phosphoribosyltransferase